MKNFKNVTKRGLAMLLALVMIVGAMSLTAFAAEEEKTTPDSALGDIIKDIGNKWSEDDNNDADNLTNGALDAIQPGNTTDKATADDVKEAAAEKGDNVVTDVANAGAAANGLKNSLENSVNKADQYQAVVDEDGKPVLDEDGNVVTEAVKGEDGETVTGSLDAFVTVKAGQVAAATQEADGILSGIKDIIGEVEDKETVSLSKEQYDEVMEKCEQVEKQYNAAAIACAEANAAVKAAQDVYDAAIAEARKALGEEYANKTDSEVIEAYNAKITTANDNLKKAQEALTKTQADLANLEDAKNILEQYNNAIEELKKLQDISAADIAKILAGIDGADAEAVLKALQNTKEGSNNVLVDTAADYALAEKDLQEKQAALEALPKPDQLTSAVEVMVDYGTQADVSNIKDLDSLYQAIDDALAAVKTEAANKGIAEKDYLIGNRGIVTEIEKHLSTVKTLEAKKASNEQLTSSEQNELDNAMKKLFKNDVGYTALVRQLGSKCASHGNTIGMDKTADNSTSRKKAHDVIEILDHMMNNSAAVQVKDQAKQQAIDVAQNEVNNAQKALDEIDLSAALEAYLKDKDITSDIAVDTAKKMATILAQSGNDYEALVNAYKDQVADSKKQLEEAQAKLKNAQEAYLVAKKLVDGQKGSNTALDADELANLLNTAKNNLTAAKANLAKAQETKDAIDNVKDIITVIAPPDPYDPYDPYDPFDDFGGGDEVEIDDEAVPLAAGPVTRAEFVDYLWRHEGEPEAPAPTFADVPADHDFAPAIGWAQSIGLVAGNEKGEFEPDELVTVAAVRTILTRFAAYAGMTMPELTTLTGGDGEAVLNCDAVLAEFFGEDLAELAA